jgi:enamine deaminase RidA (YjgF/YER057c/UK114 family)
MSSREQYDNRSAGRCYVGWCHPSTIAHEEVNMSFEARLQERGYSITPLDEIFTGKYVQAVQTGSLIYTAGQVSNWNGQAIKGYVGRDLTVEQGYEAAQHATLNCLRAVKTVSGSLDRVTRIVKVLGMVNVAPGFADTPRVIHGCSDLLLDIFGEAGQHARSAIGVTIPYAFAVEIEMIVEVA